MKRQSYLIILLQLSFCGCASFAAAGKNLTIQDLKDHSKYFAQTNVTVYGYLKMDALGNKVLFASETYADRSDFQNGIDVVQKTDLIKFSRDECVLINGKFIPYDGNFLPLDFLRSNIGLIEAKTLLVRSCN